MSLCTIRACNAFRKPVTRRVSVGTDVISRFLSCCYQIISRPYSPARLFITSSSNKLNVSDNYSLSSLSSNSFPLQHFQPVYLSTLILIRLVYLCYFNSQDARAIADALAFDPRCVWKPAGPNTNFLAGVAAHHGVCRRTRSRNICLRPTLLAWIGFVGRTIYSSKMNNVIKSLDDILYK